MYVEGRNINADTAVQYIEVVYSAFPQLFHVERIDGTGGRKDYNFTDAAKKKISFDSFVDLLGYMKKNGWQMTRRDIAFEANQSNGSMHGFVLFERANTVPAH